MKPASAGINTVTGSNGVIYVVDDQGFIYPPDTQQSFLEGKGWVEVVDVDSVPGFTRGNVVGKYVGDELSALLNGDMSVALSLYNLTTGTADIQTIQANQLHIFTGTATLGTASNFHILSLADAATTGVSCMPNLKQDVGYEVYVWISGSAANASKTPCYAAFDLQIVNEQSSLSGGSSKYTKIETDPVANVPTRMQLPLGVIKVSSTGQKIASIRFDRRGADSNDTYTGALQIHAIEFVQTSSIVDATVTDAGSLVASVYSTPFDGQKVQAGFAIYTPIWTAADGVYVAEPVTISGVEQSRLAKLNKSTYATISNAQMNAGPHDSIIGHRDSSVCVDSDNTVILHGENHYAPWIGKYALNGNTSSLTGITAPTGSNTNQSYRRFFRNPYNGDIWLGIRGNNYISGVYKWNKTTKAFDRMGGSMIAGDGGSGGGAGFGPGVGYYGMEIAFASATTMYVTLEPMRVTTGGLSGYPRQNISVLKSVDGGATFTTMKGEQISLPATLGSEGDYAFPSYNNSHNTVIARLAVLPNGQPVVVASWKHPEEPYRSLWSARWDNLAKQWIRNRIMESPSTNDCGNPSAIYLQNGTVYVTAAPEDDHNASGGAGSEVVPPVQPVMLFKSTDGVTWSKWTISAPAAGYGGAYLDPESIRLDGVIRMLPRNETSPSVSQVWECQLV